MASLPLVLLTSLMIMSVAELRAKDGGARGMICNSCNSSCSSRRRLQEFPIKGRRPVVLRKEAPIAVVNHELRLQNTSSLISTADLVVAQDGSGDYKTITEALTVSQGMRRINTKHFVIYVKRGIYDEIVNIDTTMTNLTLVGDGIDLTVVTGNRSFSKGFNTFQTATFAVEGDGFIAQNMTFENTAGPQMMKAAVALRASSDLSVFYRCSFKGYQDTLYAHAGHQFYRECDIYGTIDFIFGDAAAVFQNCNILIRRPRDGQENVVTAQGREILEKNTGFSFHMSKVMAAQELKPVQALFKTYLGRPWKKYSRTVFMKCTLEDVIDPSGWLRWDNHTNFSTLYYGEYMNTGVGAGTSGRVKWPGFHIITSTLEANKFTVNNFLNGSSWIPETGVPFTPGL